MIISHKHQFIFIKPRKVAGSSVELNLRKYCGDDDMFTPLVRYSKENDQTQYDCEGRNDTGFKNHMTPNEIIEKIGIKKWSQYKKITIVRNPWEVTASLYWWRKAERRSFLKNNVFPLSVKKFRNKEFFNSLYEYLRAEYDFRRRYFERSDFERFLIDQKTIWNNTPFYFDNFGKKFCDIYLRYESIHKDYAKLCTLLSLPEEELPLVKNRTRVKEIKVSDMFSPKSMELVQSECERIATSFAYTFPH